MHGLRGEQGLPEMEGSAPLDNTGACHTMNMQGSPMRNVFTDVAVKFLGLGECFPTICHLG